MPAGAGTMGFRLGERFVVEVGVKADQEQIAAADRRRSELARRPQEVAEELVVVGRGDLEFGDLLALGDP